MDLGGILPQYPLYNLNLSPRDGSENGPDSGAVPCTSTSSCGCREEAAALGKSEQWAGR